MKDALSTIIQREAAKLLKRSMTEESLSKEDLELLEILSRCAKALRGAPEAPTGDAEPASSTKDDLAALGD